MDEPEIRKCADHADRPAVAACVTCGKTLCAECVREGDGKYYCAWHAPSSGPAVAKPRRPVRPLPLFIVAALIALVWAALYFSAPAVEKAARVSSQEMSRARLDEVATALDAFKKDVGRYPTQEEGLGALLEAPPEVKAAWLGPYLPASYGKGGVLTDADGNALGYRALEKEHVVFARGADGKLGTGDDARLKLEGREAAPEPRFPRLGNLLGPGRGL